MLFSKLVLVICIRTQVSGGIRSVLLCHDFWLSSRQYHNNLLYLVLKILVSKINPFSEFSEVLFLSKGNIFSN